MADADTIKCDQTATCTVVQVAPIDPASSNTNVKTVWRRLRIQVLDCRSALPIKRTPVLEVRLDDAPVARYQWDESGWDISKHLPLYKKGSSWMLGKQTLTGTLKGHGKASQIALTALGYNTGSPSETYGTTGKAKYRQYQLDRGVLEADLKEVPDEAGRDAIIKEYNTRCYKMAQFHLAASGYCPGGAECDEQTFIDGTATGEWNADWTTAYHNFQKIELGLTDPYDWVKTAEGGKALMDARKNFVTDDLGIIRVPVPIAKVKAGFSVELSFKDFAIVAEATREQFDNSAAGTVCREEKAPAGSGQPAAGATKFSVEWVETTQDPARDKPWGWRIGRKRAADAAARSAMAEFRTSWKFTVPGTGADDPDAKWSKLHAAKKVFSRWYTDVDDPEYVVFALIWCQPVWDGLEDPDSRADRLAISENAYVFPGGDAHLNMHVTSVYHDLAGSEIYGGKGYGLWEYVAAPRWRGKDNASDAEGGHRGFDIHAGVGHRVFAVHSGKVTNSTQSVGGNVVTVTWKAALDEQAKISYLHNSEFKITNNTAVRAGQVVAYAGRTGNLSAVSAQPGHVHLNVGTENALYDSPDVDNRICLPSNERTPLLFPCHCEVTATASDPEGCDFDKDFAKTCWAVAELACPYMPATITAADTTAAGATGRKARRRIQAQLRHLHENNSGSYSTPGVLDADIGAAPPAAGATGGAAYSPGTTRKAIYKYKQTRAMLPDPATDEQKYGIDQALIDDLDAQAPIITKG
jgi:Peptidase family M23